MVDPDRRIVLVTRHTRLQELVARYNTVEQARFHAEHLGMDFGDFIQEDRTYQVALGEVVPQLERVGKLQQLERSFLANFLFPPTCLVVVLGQDGLVANTLKYLTDQPVLAINPDPKRIDGVLLPFVVSDFTKVLAEALVGRRAVREVTMARATLNDGQRLLAVNDLFVGARSHVSARYEIELGETRERQSSSGVIVSTGLGSTGWLRSILAGAMEVSGTLPNAEVIALRRNGFSWDERRLIFSVREPFPSKSSQSHLVFGDIAAGASLRIRSLMPDGGIIFSDGLEADGMEFRSGVVAEIGVHDRCSYLLH